MSTNLTFKYITNYNSTIFGYFVTTRLLLIKTVIHEKITTQVVVKKPYFYKIKEDINIYFDMLPIIVVSQLCAL